MLSIIINLTINLFVTLILFQFSLKLRYYDWLCSTRKLNLHI